MSKPRPTTLGELRASGWRGRSVKREIRANLVRRLRARETLFPGLIGYERTVLPQVVQALLAGHDFILLGLRGQAKTRLLRGLPGLLDELLPVVAGSEIRDDPLAPLSAWARRRAAEMGDALPVEWVPKEQRYHEKLATPDATIADLIGDIDPIKAATKKLSFGDPEVLHFGLIPRSHRGIVVINELPDLPARIQVGLLNVLEEGDVQIRGLPLRLPLDLLMAFSANPEDYTNRGSIITPLKDRIASQIHTHYPRSLEEAAAITDQEAWIERGGEVEVVVPAWLRETVERVAFEARASDFVDQNSGVSARVSIALLELVVSAAERRALCGGAHRAVARVADVYAGLPALTGKLELVYEGEREGAQAVARHVAGRAVKAVFERAFAAQVAEESRGAPRGKGKEGRATPGGGPQDGADEGPFRALLRHFRGGRTVELDDELAGSALLARLREVPELEAMARRGLRPEGGDETAAAMEFVLDGLAQRNLLAKEEVVGGRVFKDPFEDLARQMKG